MNAVRVAQVATLCVASMATVVIAQQTPVFRGGVNLIHLDVSVLDKDRRPIRGLTAADFTVLEDGKPQPIVAFADIEVPDAPAPSASWLRHVAPDVQSNADANRPESRLFVLLLDDALIPFDAASIQSAKRIARRVIDQANPADRIAVVFSAGSGGTQNFTNDRARLLKAVETLNPSYAKHTLGWESAPPSQLQKIPNAPPVWPMMDPDIPYRQASMRTLDMVAEALIAAPERRKVLLFVSPGLAVDPASVSLPLARGYKSPPLAIKMANDDIVKALPELFRRMQRANVTIYPIDPCGFDGFENYTLQVARGLPALRNEHTGPLGADYNWFAPSIAPPPEALGQRVATLSMDFLMTAASNTGGRAIVNTNDFEAGLDRMFRENGSFYLLGVAAARGAAPGSLHRLNVRVNRPDVEVRTRSGYQTPAATKASEKATPPVAAIVAGPIAKGDLPMRVALAPFSTPNGPIVAIALGMRQTDVVSASAQVFTLQISAFTPDGQPRRWERRTASVTLLPVGGTTTAEFEFLSQIALAPGRYEIRVGAHRAADDTAGSVYADVEVPDFERAPLSLSGVVVHRSPAVAGGPRDLFAAIVPIVPTAAREFSSSARVTGFVRIHQATDGPLRPVTLTARLVDTTDTPLLDTAEEIGTDRFSPATRAADYRFRIPVESLKPGEYLLTLDTAAGSAAVTRHLRFAVK